MESREEGECGAPGHLGYRTKEAAKSEFNKSPTVKTCCFDRWASCKARSSLVEGF